MTLAQVWCVSRTSYHPILMRSWCGCLDTLYDSPFYSLLPIFSHLPFHSLVLHLLLPWCGGQVPCALSRMRTLGTLAENDPLTGYEPNDYHISEATELYIQESSGENRSLNSHDLEFDDYTIGMALSSPLFTQDREDAAIRRQAYHSPEESMLSSQSLSVGHVRTARPVTDEFGSLISNVTENPCRESENEQIRILLERQKEQILADCRAEIQRTRVPSRLWQKKYTKIEWNDRVAETRTSYCAQADERRRQYHQLLHEQLKQNLDLREANEKSLNEMEELKRFQAQHSTQLRRENWSKDRDTILELTSKIQELQNEINCMNDSRDFQDAESVRSGHSHVTSQPVFFAPHPVPGGMPNRSIGMPSRKDGPPSICDTHGISGNVFANPAASSSAAYPQELNPWSSNISKHASPHVMSVKAKQKFRIRDASQDRQPEIQSSLVRETFQRIMEPTNNDCRFQIFT